MAALRALDLSFREGGLGAHFRVPVLSAGEVGQEKGDDATASGVSSARSRTRGPCLSRKPDASGGISDFSGEFPIQALFAKVPIYERYGKISERAYSGK